MSTKEKGTRGGSITLAVLGILAGALYDTVKAKVFQVLNINPRRSEDDFGDDFGENNEVLDTPLRLMRFVRLRRSEVRASINALRARNDHGGLNWTREDYIAYALARPIPRDCPKDWESEDDARTRRFRKHEFYSNDNFSVWAVARILWRSGLVIVNGEMGTGENDLPPFPLIDYVSQLAPWFPKPPSNKHKKVA